MTRAMERRNNQNKPFQNVMISLHASATDFKTAQREDASLKKCLDQVNRNDDGSIRFILFNDFLYREKHAHTCVTRQLVVPSQFRMDVLKLAHDIPLADHQGMRRTKKRIQSQFYWPGMYREINKYVKSCHICQKCSKKGPATSRAPLQKMPVITTPFHRLAIDLVGPLAKSDRGHRFILTVVDVATRWVEAVALKETTTEMVAEALLTIYARLGIPKEILSDHGPQFISDLMNQVCRLMGIKHVYSSIFHPSSNGMCERINGVIKAMLRKVADKHPGDWDRLLPSVLFAYRETPQDGTKFSPFELMYGRTPRGIMSVLKELYTDQELVQEVKTTYQYVIDLERRIYDSCQLAAAKSSENADKATIYADRGAELRSLKPDDKVLVLLPQTKNKLLMRWQGPYIVRERISKVDYVVNVKGIDKVYHINILKLYHEREEEGNAFMSLGVTLINDDCSSQTETMSLKIPSMVQSEYVKDVNVSNIIPDHIRTHLDTLLTDNADILTDLPALPDLTKQFVVRTDASDSGIGGVLLQQWDDDLLPCAYVSRKLKVLNN
ncbi:gypsy retrotransposon integrase-like protein 1 [Plakobranchus ocellatus]|uniref:Gypsy retrotransposon integrase-like protein 1 n=1 Tax=Plakobranchus ocellatus TaxID=259542 RepID=A0AAV4BDM7_9GAST|nr:gypsy retrotransposon integrase-like protein 1 [Plakobranchus ocellatus]